MASYQLLPRFIYDAIKDQRAYFVSMYTEISNSGSGNIHIRNPDSNNSNPDVWIAATDVMTDGDAVVYMHDSFDSIADGNDIAIQNARMDVNGNAPDQGPFEAFKNSSFTASSNATVPIGLTESGPPNSETTSYYPSMIDEGREFILEVDSSQSSDLKVVISMLLITPH